MRLEETPPTRSLILPPRFEDRAAANEALMATIPAYVEEHSASLRPTWLPVDPSTYAPPRITTKKFSFATIGKISLGLVATFALSFSMVVAPQLAREFAAKRALANASAPVSENASPRDPIVSARASSSNGSASQTKPAESGVILTVNVNDLPVSRPVATTSPRDRKSGSRRAGS